MDKIGRPGRQRVVAVALYAAALILLSACNRGEPVVIHIGRQQVNVPAVQTAAVQSAFATLTATAPTGTPEPGQAPFGTATDAPPVATPEPLPSLEAADPTDILTYMQETTPYLTAILEAQMTLSNLLADPNASDANWRNQVDEILATVRLNYDELAKVVPPVSLAATHELVVGAGKDCNQAMEYLVNWMQDNDVSALSAGLDLLLSCSDKINAMSQQLTEAGSQEEAP